MGLLHSSKKARIIAFLIDFFFTTILPFIHSILFFNFAFFSGDLRYNLYLIPLSFLYSFLSYYFFTFVYGTWNYIRLVLKVTSKDPLTDSELNSTVITRDLSELKFSITSYGYSQGFYDDGISHLIDCWIETAQLIVSFSFKKKLSLISYILLIITLSSQVFIVYQFPNVIYAGFFNFFKFSRVVSKSHLPTRSPQEAFRVKKPFEKSLEKT
jgi:hypothetical protein